jgi:hypothetical protein
MDPSGIFCELRIDASLLFSDSLFRAADPILNFAGVFFRVPGDFHIRIVRRLSNLFLNLSLHFVELAFGPVLRTWFHDLLLFSFSVVSIELLAPEDWSELIVLQTMPGKSGGQGPFPGQLERDARDSRRRGRTHFLDKVSGSAQHFRSK